MSSFRRWRLPAQWRAGSGKSWRRSWGLPVEMKVAAGCHDQCAATLGSGGVSAGDMAAGEGSTESLNLVAEKEAITEPFLEKNICFEPYVKTGQYQIPVGTVFTRHLSSMVCPGIRMGLSGGTPDRSPEIRQKKEKACMILPPRPALRMRENFFFCRI